MTTSLSAPPFPGRKIARVYYNHCLLICSGLGTHLYINGVNRVYTAIAIEPIGDEHGSGRPPLLFRHPISMVRGKAKCGVRTWTLETRKTKKSHNNLLDGRGTYARFSYNTRVVCQRGHHLPWHSIGDLGLIQQQIRRKQENATLRFRGTPKS